MPFPLAVRLCSSEILRHVHTVMSNGQSWLDGRLRPAAAYCPMPLDLSADELAIAAMACRAMAYQEGQRAKRMENPTTRGPIEAAAQRYAALAKKFEAARKRA
jgi:hypothetical protein